MDAHEYIFFFSKFEYFMYFLVDRFFGPVFFGSDLVHIFGGFDDRSGSDNTDSKCWASGFVNQC
jgi:hypothetical protein